MLTIYNWCTAAMQGPPIALFWFIFPVQSWRLESFCSPVKSHASQVSEESSPSHVLIFITLILLALSLPLLLMPPIRHRYDPSRPSELIFQFFLPHSFIIFLSREELHDQAFSFHRCVVLFHCTEGKRSSDTERWKETRETERSPEKEREMYHCTKRSCRTCVCA